MIQCSRRALTCSLTALILGCSIGLAGAAAQSAAGAAPSPNPAQMFRGQRVHRGQPIHDAFGTATCKPAGLLYNGGPVVSNPVVVPVFWSGYVNAAVQQKMPQFLADMIQSDDLLQLSEYATDTPSVADGSTMTKQSVGLGSAHAGIILSPLKCAGPAACTLQEADVQAEISRQIGLHVLPAPTLAYDGQVQTFYMLYLPPNVTVVASDKSSSCISWCGIHSNASYPLTGTKTTPLLYGMIGDSVTGACAGGCGSNADAIQNMASTTWHELAEGITDPLAAPLTWYDNSNNCGEIGDLCDDGTAYAVSINGHKWSVQSLWSNKLNACTLGGVLPSLKLSAPATVTATDSFKLTMAVVNPSAGHSKDTAFTGTVQFASTDKRATLPAPYSFTRGDSGSTSMTATLDTGGSQTIYANDSDTSIKGSASVSVNSTISVKVGTQPAGLSFVVDGVSYKSATTFNWSAGDTHTLSTAASQFPSTGVKDVFTTWSDGGIQSHKITVSAATSSYTAVFATSYQLITAVSPAADGTIWPASGSYFAAGTVVKLAAATINSVKFVFAGWTGDVSGAYPAASITMNAPHSVTANFSAEGKNAATLQVSSTANPSLQGQAVTLNITVSGKSGTPGGYLEIYLPGTEVGHAVLKNGGATFQTPALSFGYQIFTVVYSGDKNYKLGATAYEQEVDSKSGPPPR